MTARLVKAKQIHPELLTKCVDLCELLWKLDIGHEWVERLDWCKKFAAVYDDYAYLDDTEN